MSAIGDTLVFVALPWYALQSTGSPALTGLVGAATASAAVIGGILGGPIVDRLGFFRSSVVADIAAAAPVAALVIVDSVATLAYWQLIALAFASALFDLPGLSARQNVLPLLTAGGSAVESGRATGLYFALQRAGFMVGAPVAGLLMAAWGFSAALLLNIGSFAASAVAVGLAAALCRRGRTRLRAAAPAPANGNGYRAELMVGFRCIRSNPLLLLIVWAAIVLSLLDAPFLAVILPVYVERAFGDSGSFGLLVGAFGGGMLLGSVLYGMVGHRLPRMRVIALTLAVIAAAYLTLAAVRSFPGAVAAVAVMGLAAGPINPILVSVIQQQVPARLVGRVMASLFALVLATAPIGRAGAGALLAWVSPIALLLGIGGGYLLVTAALLSARAFRAADTKAAVPEEARAERGF